MSDAADRNFTSVFDMLPVERPVRLPGGYRPGLFDTPAGVDEAGALLQAGTRQVMRENHGAIPIIGYVFCQNDPVVGTQGDALYRVQLKRPKLQDGEVIPGRDKDILSCVIQALALMGNARAYALLSEAWAAQTKNYRTLDGHDSLATHPGREEIVFVSVHDVDGPGKLWRAPLTTYGPRARSIGTWEGWDVAGGGDRFSGLLEPLRRVYARRADPTDRTTRLSPAELYDSLRETLPDQEAREHFRDDVAEVPTQDEALAQVLRRHATPPHREPEGGPAWRPMK